jgi:hypothetical protein
MPKIVTVVSVAALLLVLNLQGTANAQLRSTASGQTAASGKCPTNTCAKDGSGFAKNVRNCSAANCRK